MKISIITATFNNEDTIFWTIESIRSQTFRNIEHLVADGKSSDKTLDIVRQLSPQSKIISEPDDGLYDALNKGISRANGDVIGFLHGDDIFDHDRVIEGIAQVFDNQEVDGIYGDLIYIRRNGSIVRKWKSGIFESGMLEKGWMPPHPTLFLRSEVYENFGNFNTEFQIAADYDFMLRILRSGKLVIRYIPENLVRMSTGGVSNKSIGNIIRKSYEDYKALKQNRIPGPVKVLFKKNFSKLGQFF